MILERRAQSVQFCVDYPDRPLDRLTTFFRLFVAIPILIVLGGVEGGTWEWTSHNQSTVLTFGAGGLLCFAPLVMIVFRQKYPRWWFDWNKQLLRFSNRVAVYLMLMDDRYPSTDEEQSVHLEFPYPDVRRDLNRWLPLIKWLLVLPHLVILAFLGLCTLCAVLAAWVMILLKGWYPREIFDFVEGVIRWGDRVACYAFLLVTDEYPPFRLAP